MITLIFGDSIAYGAWDTTNHGWAHLLKRDASLNGDLLYNLSIDGNCSTDILQRMRNEIAARYQWSPEENLRIIFAFGTNDASRINGTLRTGPNTFKRNLSEIYAFAASRTKDIIFVGPFLVDQRKTTPVQWDKSLWYRNEDIIHYNTIMHTWCLRKEIKFVSCLELFFNRKNLLVDGIHPDFIGHMLIYGKIENNTMLATA